MASFFFGILGGILAWLTSQTIAEPIRWLWTLRREARVELKELARSWPIKSSGDLHPEYPMLHYQKAEKDRSRLANLGQQLAAFTELHPRLSSIYAKWWKKYDLMEAADGFTSLAGHLHTSNMRERREAERNIKRGLGFKDVR